ncbi:hypothetical protein ANT_24430 [Anaerolinea thermophila UNI-1]|uniref:Uncharacterized protein n=1 Tax=Anaerolinea thermophila (strain DSM 14523 / JCM 11388 / NBRC 100420 / UNI-1) TaxID=926569 RepID=E8MYY3_ANATU|nr:hypothetical protein ANT_24430 [Anaerolinea thermophila UNI-1]
MAVQPGGTCTHHRIGEPPAHLRRLEGEDYHVACQGACRSLPAVTSPGRLPMVSPAAPSDKGSPSLAPPGADDSAPLPPPYAADVSVAKTEFRRAGLEPAITHLPPERL